MDNRKLARELVRMAKEISSADTFKCPECGTNVLEKTKYCVKCKKKVENPNEKKAAEDDNAGPLKKLDPKLNAIVNKIDNAVGPDLDSLLTAVLMVMRRHGYKAESNQLYNLFRPIMKKMQVKLNAASIKNRKRLTD